MSRFQIMDVTLRDGSYQINFQFSNADVRRIGGELDKLGIPFIEIGHGQGIGASEAGQGRALHTDEEYLAELRGSQDPNPEREWEKRRSGVFPY